MKTIIFSIVCFISIGVFAESPIEQVKHRLKQGDTQNATMGGSISSFLDNNRDSIKKSDLDAIFEILKAHCIKNKNSCDDILSAMTSVYYISKEQILKGKVIYFMEQIINDSTLDNSVRGIGSQYISGVDLSIFNKKMKNEIVKNLHYTYKNDPKHMLSSSMILLAGALNMTELKDRLQIIADSSISSGDRNAALMALCRIGDKKALEIYFAKLSSMKLQDVTHYHWGEVRYIKQKESVDLILKVLYSEETEPFVDERLPDQKIAYSAVYALQRISTNFPYKKRIVYGKKEDPLLEQAREWAKNNEIIINRDIW